MLFKNTKKLLLAIIVLLSLTQNSYTLGLVLTDWNIVQFTKVIIGIFFALLFVAGLLLFIGILTNNKPLNFFVLWKFIVFPAAACTLWYVGSTLNNGYRGMNDGWLRIWYDRIIVTVYGKNNRAIVMSRVKNADGLLYPNYRNFWNVTIVDSTLLIILRFLAFSSNKKLSNLGRSAVLCFSSRVLHLALKFFKQESNIRESKKTGETWERSTIQYIITYIICILTLIFILEEIVYLFLNGLKLMKESMENSRKSPYKEGKKGEDDEYGFKHRPRKNPIY